ncbi:hypothetical protein NPIL_369301 [Nephila pilipes]|uniref:Uncharacterized protein n=1 Tax=Nephila pilipes TaxID=299642 RepID=A0A8X6N8U0_NEPPI|nr:hypothetical protein NPIL_369301 [Nephila pilipes]
MYCLNSILSLGLPDTGLSCFNPGNSEYLIVNTDLELTTHNSASQRITLTDVILNKFEEFLPIRKRPCFNSAVCFENHAIKDELFQSDPIVLVKRAICTVSCVPMIPGVNNSTHPYS